MPVQQDAQRRRRRSSTATIAGLVAFTALALPTLAHAASIANSVTTARQQPPTTGVLEVPGGFSTIQLAIDAAGPGDRILVAPGTYPGTIDFHGKDVHLLAAAGPATTIIDGGGEQGVLMGPLGTVEGFTVTNTAGNRSGAFDVKGVGARIVGNVIAGNVQPRKYSGGGVAIGGGGWAHVEGNVFRDNTCRVDSLVNLAHSVITSNVFEDNPGCTAVVVGGPMAVDQLVNNTIVRNDVGVYIPGSGYTSDDFVIRNNIVVDNRVGLKGRDDGDTDEPGHPMWQHNLVFGNDTDYEAIDDQTGRFGNVSVDPGFVDPQGDYHLRPDSAAIDAGSGNSAPRPDFDHRPRPLDGDGDGVGLPDMGAFEADGLPQPAATSITIALEAPLIIVRPGGTIHHRLTVANTGHRSVHHLRVADSGGLDCDAPTPELLAGATTTINCDRVAVMSDGDTFKGRVVVEADGVAPMASRRIPTYVLPIPVYFSDVDRGTHCGLHGIDWIVLSGVMSGYPDGTFRPRRVVPRSEAVEVLWRFADAPTGAPDASYRDVPPDASYREAVNWARATGILRSPSDRFRPDDPLTRAQLTFMLWNLARRPTDSDPLPARHYPRPGWNRKAFAWALDPNLPVAVGDSWRRPGSTVKRDLLAGTIATLAGQDTAWRAWTDPPLANWRIPEANICDPDEPTPDLADPGASP